MPQGHPQTEPDRHSNKGPQEAESGMQGIEQGLGFILLVTSDYSLCPQTLQCLQEGRNNTY